MNKVGTKENPLLGPILVKNDSGQVFWRGGDSGRFESPGGMLSGVKFTGTNSGDIGFASGNNKWVVTFTVGDGVEVVKQIFLEATCDGKQLKEPVFIAPTSASAIALFTAEAEAKGWSMVAIPAEEVRAQYNLPDYGWVEPPTAVKQKIVDLFQEALDKATALLG